MSVQTNESQLMIPEDVKERIINFSRAKKNTENICSEFEKQKKSFYKFMSSFMIKLRDSKMSDMNYFDGHSFKFKYKSGMFNVTEINPVSVKFDVDLLEKRLGRKNARKVISKTYTISDYDGLVKYLKSINASPEIFKSFICVSKSVDSKELDNLSNLGYISEDDIKGCYEVNKKPTYYKVSFTESSDVKK